MNNFFETDDEEINAKLRKFRQDVIMNAKIYRDGIRGNSTKRKNELERLVNNFVGEFMEDEG